jgi:hypothetical protein
MKHIQGYTGSHWMPPSGECLRRIAPTAAMVDKFVENTQNTNKHNFLIVITIRYISITTIGYENFNPEMEPIQVIKAKSFILL